eukprot:c19126_g2_i1 orf=304-561(-)
MPPASMHMTAPSIRRGRLRRDVILWFFKLLAAIPRAVLSACIGCFDKELYWSYKKHHSLNAVITLKQLEKLKLYHTEMCIQAMNK